jgi:Fe-S-cluster containining protein
MNIPLSDQEVTAFNHPCKGCGECCSQFLPVTDMEIRVIKKYAKDHEIKPNYQPIMCPFFDLNTRLCKIYEVRPYICKKYDCRKHKSGQLFQSIDNYFVKHGKITDMGAVFCGGD